jgi:hypothetical protein
MYDEADCIARWRGKPLRRPPHSPTPCWKCPKHSPAHAAGYERDADRIERTLQLYFRLRAGAGGATRDFRSADALLSRNLAIIDAIVRRWERAQAAARK